MHAEIDEYLTQRRAEGLSEATLCAYRDGIRKLAAFLRTQGIQRWQDVRQSHFDAFLRQNKQAGYSFRSREHYLIDSRTFLRWLADRGKILADPSRHVELPRPNKDDLPLLEPPLGEQEVADLLSTMPRQNATDLRNIAFLETLYSAGLRLSESVALQLADLDFHNRTLHVRRGKGNKERELPMMRGLYGALRDYLALRRSLLRGPDHGALWVDVHGRQWKLGGVQQVFNRLNGRRKKAGLRHVHPHLFRHSIAVHLLRGGADIRYVQAFLGHDSLESTRVYLRLVPEDLRDAYDKAMPEVSLEPDGQ